MTSATHINLDVINGDLWCESHKTGEGTPWAVYTGRVARWEIPPGADVGQLTAKLVPFAQRLAGCYRKIGNRVLLTDDGILIMWQMFLIIENS